ncbi:TPA: hypothetical protein DEP21_02880 [Patescibacteria group bacterium]|nr:hypothetical protein [Candidatus Gracilibacteria bacterium]
MYVIDRGNSSQTSITIDGKTWNQSPFTIITYGLNVIIKGNVDVNGMFIVNNGNIIFEPEDCNQQQTVKGIFIVNNGSFNSRKSSNQASIVNNSLNDPRCNAGGLYVKGVLIGNGIETLVSQRRASLPTWFYVNGSEKSIQVQRRNQILNGAAVVIEYSPDLWVQLPPGAEEFTSTLDVYKK